MEWERSWKNAKILKYSTRVANELRRGVRETPTVEEMKPEVDATREYWVPTPEQVTALAAIENAGARAASETTMFVALRRAMLEDNARRKAVNEVAKTQD